MRTATSASESSSIDRHEHGDPALPGRRVRACVEHGGERAVDARGRRPPDDQQQARLPLRGHPRRVGHTRDEHGAAAHQVDVLAGRRRRLPAEQGGRQLAFLGPRSAVVRAVALDLGGDQRAHDAHDGRRRWVCAMQQQPTHGPVLAAQLIRARGGGAAQQSALVRRRSGGDRDRRPGVVGDQQRCLERSRGGARDLLQRAPARDRLGQRPEPVRSRRPRVSCPMQV
jgi:hypothetical protein